MGKKPPPKSLRKVKKKRDRKRKASALTKTVVSDPCPPGRAGRFVYVSDTLEPRRPGKPKGKQKDDD